MRHVTPEGIDLIKRFEGLRLTPYLCPAGYYTIGYGHVLRNKPFPESITEEEANTFLEQDISYAELTVLRLIYVYLTDNQFNALVDFTYNLGSAALQRSTLRMKINRRESSGISGEFMRWTYGGGRKLKGLVERRFAEAQLYKL